MGLRAATQLLQQTLTAAFVLGKLQTNGHLQLVSSHNLTYRSRNKRLIFRCTAMTIYFKAKLYINKLFSLPIRKFKILLAKKLSTKITDFEFFADF